MCAQVICEIPDECTFNNNASGGEMACGDYCPPACDPCYVPPAFPPCPPGPCDCRCDCGDMGCCYQQPARVKPIRPPPSQLRSTAPLETDTIYKRSYYANCGDCFRSSPIKPCPNLKTPSAPPEKCTIHRLSYLPPMCAVPVSPIKPKDNGLKFNGPLYALTSQKHDYVPKGYSRRDPIRPIAGIVKVVAPLERCTINRLSYMPNDIGFNPPRKPIKPDVNQIMPTGPSEKCTVHKLSYLPVCLPAKEPQPWAERVHEVPPPYQNLCTTYNLSYMPNCNPNRSSPIYPGPGLKSLGNDITDGNTVYKLSYMPVDGRCCRPDPIRPIGGLEKPTGKMENCTIQKLSYLPNCCTERTQPIRPKGNRIQPCGPIHFITTQKHDFVPKPICKRDPIKHEVHILRATGPMERCTINRLSYMPVCNYKRPDPIRPGPGISRMEGNVENCTTYKLSYLPNCVKPREDTPWARYSEIVKPTGPMEKCTIQKLSYGPPGTFNRCGACCNTNNNPSDYPTAGICN